MTTDDQKLDRGTKVMIAIGALLLIVPTVAVLTLADGTYRAHCKAMCNPQGLSYRTETGGGPVAGQFTYAGYPAKCYCIEASQRTVWEKLRDVF